MSKSVRVIKLDDDSHSYLVDLLNEKRNNLIEGGKSTNDVDSIFQSTISAKRKKDRSNAER